jgi:ABC-type nickel/cobalt efflux system permease component RcnA
MRRIIALFAVIAVVAGAVLATRENASAHPLGNFTINHSTIIEIAESGVTVYRVLDIAEIPAFQTLQQIPTDPNGNPMLTDWAAEQADQLAVGMTLTVNDEQIQLATASHEASLLEGQGGLQTIRLDIIYRADLPHRALDGAATLTYADANYGDRIGWREVIARGGPGVDLVGSALPVESVTDFLHTYPETGLSSPPDVRKASFSFEPGVGGSSIVPVTGVEAQANRATRGNPDGALAGFTKLISEKELSAGFIAFALLAAVAFGAIHALSPGHGKTVVAAYLIGTRGTLRHAVLLGFVVTATHTSTVYLLGFVTLYLSQYIVPEDLYPWMGIIAGGIILIMGLVLFVGRVRATGVLSPVAALLRPGRMSLANERGGLQLAEVAASPREHSYANSHEHGLDHHQSSMTAAVRPGTAVPKTRNRGEDTAHSHGFGSHTHDVPGANEEPVTWQRLVGLGVFGGMIPCPSAIVVMLSAIALHRVGFGLVLIVAFSVGLASVLTGIGFLVVWAQRVPLLQRAMDRAEHSSGITALIVRGLPIAAAALVCLVGIVLVTRAAGQF